MALPIKETPILKGKEAREFQKKADANKNKCASRKEVKVMLDKAAGMYIKNYFGKTSYEKELEAMRKFAKSLTKETAARKH